VVHAVDVEHVHTGVVDQHVQPAEFGVDLGGQRVDLFLGGDVELDRR
jgi:hypothetical protein